ncbi:hypothetical protein NGF19_24225 [Streptomyces sp. RY43-2]|uniref:Secreted protein n=1 Tax=Streptomyces macrolidinus TaxID=2952607 RepID=A0ABT0ZJT9_9ACTN|nr:hypothetical protein [Streptomyces macrolidinus]MCN9243849.1 hypothetical protein [Streptomyces macrolidinus]
MARHASPHAPTARRVLVALATTGVALGVGAGAASADTGTETRSTSLGQADPQAGLQALTGTVGYVTGPLANLKPNPLAGTGVDPLDNGVGTQLSDFKPLTSQTLTRPVAQASSIGSVPVVGQLLSSLH